MKTWNLDVRGLSLVIRQFGEDNGGIPTICLHGWLDHGMAFARVVEQQHGLWIAPDQRGFGPVSYTHLTLPTICSV